MVYFMRAASGLIKIGTAVDIDTRRRALELRYGQALEVLASGRGNRTTERAHHKRFRKYRIDRTEWFLPGPKLMEYLGRPEETDYDRDAVTLLRVWKRPMVVVSPRTHRMLRLEAARTGETIQRLVDTAVSRFFDGRQTPTPAA